MRFILLNSHRKVINVITENTACLHITTRLRHFSSSQHTLKHLCSSQVHSIPGLDEKKMRGMRDLLPGRRSPPNNANITMWMILPAYIHHHTADKLTPLTNAMFITPARVSSKPTLKTFATKMQPSFLSLHKKSHLTLQHLHHSHCDCSKLTTNTLGGNMGSHKQTVGVTSLSHVKTHQYTLFSTLSSIWTIGCAEETVKLLSALGEKKNGLPIHFSEPDTIMICQEQEVRWMKRQRELLVVRTLTPGSESLQLHSGMPCLSYWL